MVVSEDVRKVANRHAARLLTKLEQSYELTDFVREGVMREMHYCAEDVVSIMEVEKNGKPSK